ncbi:uncharacterized protein PV07_04311 [Cladophialophora immunda]|uniref:peptidylprolyl isomerase n=1 Tax=Cladophialophora immunda TaxID=569365 RepID=A0A0D2CNE6_9EURO|nr:uncharacterized protein PV07_04311 [Cladophialophora immunda]KIW32788.1 hypothetical protein PV07_04311 [Cladophialophora immunda]
MASQFHKQLLFEGNGTDYPRKGDEVSIEYTGWLYDASKPDQDYKGDKFDSSVGRGAFKTQIGVGRVIEGWDHGVPQMSLGEKSRLTIPGHMAYGDRSVTDQNPPLYLHSRPSCSCRVVDRRRLGEFLASCHLQTGRKSTIYSRYDPTLFHFLAKLDENVRFFSTPVC